MKSWGTVYECGTGPKEPDNDSNNDGSPTGDPQSPSRSKLPSTPRSPSKNAKMLGTGCIIVERSPQNSPPCSSRGCGGPILAGQARASVSVPSPYDVPKFAHFHLRCLRLDADGPTPWKTSGLSVEEYAYERLSINGDMSRSAVVEVLKISNEGWGKDPPGEFMPEKGPVCACGEKPGKWMVMKDTPNKGKSYYGCKSGKCSFFLWEDQWLYARWHIEGQAWSSKTGICPPASAPLSPPAPSGAGDASSLPPPSKKARASPASCPVCTYGDTAKGAAACELCMSPDVGAYRPRVRKVKAKEER